MNHEYGYFEEDHIGNIGDLKIWTRLMGFIGSERRWVALAVVLALIITGTGLALPRFMGQSE